MAAAVPATFGINPDKNNEAKMPKADANERLSFFTLKTKNTRRISLET
jgi:hypothetical protein